jgi:hypothetical protein
MLSERKLLFENASLALALQHHAHLPIMCSHSFER